MGKPVIVEVNDIAENSFLKTLFDFFEGVTMLTKFTLRFFKQVFKPPFEFKEIVKQSYIIGYQSFPLMPLPAS